MGNISGPDGPVPGATVRILPGNTGSVADENGFFQLDNVPEGKLTIEVRSIGFREYTHLIQAKPGDTIRLEVILEENRLGLDEVVVTGTMQPTFLSKSPVKIEVITSEYFQTFMPTASASIVEGVSLVNGVQETIECGVCFTNSISINGLPGAYTAILLDGAPVYGNLAAVYGLNGIPASLIDRFEVIKGPSSTLYGSEAVAGVINIITKDPENQPFLTGDLMTTSHNEVFANAGVSLNSGKSTGYIGTNYGHIGIFEDRNNDGFSDIVNLDRYSLFTKWDLNRKSGKKWTLAGKLLYEDRRNGVESYLKDRNYRNLRGSDSLYGESIYTKRAEVFGTYEMALPGNIRLDYSLSVHRQDSYYGADHYVAEQDILFANLVWSEQVGRHSLLGGFTSRLERYDDNTVATSEENRNAASSRYIPGLFLQDEWEATPWLTLLPGARLDLYPEHGPVFSPRFSLKAKPGEWTTLRLNSGTGFRVVNLFTEDHAFVTGQRSVVIEEDLQPERSYNVALNVNHVYTLGSGQGMVDLDGFYTYFTNKIIPDYNTPGEIRYANTEGHAVSKGVGMNLSHEFAFPLSLNAGLTWQQVTETAPDEDGTMSTRQVEFAPGWSGVLTASYRWKKAGLTVGTTLQYTGPMALPEVYDLDQTGTPEDSPRPVRSEGFLTLNAQATKQLSDTWSLYAGVQNILDYIQPVSPLTGYNDPAAAPGFSSSFDTAYAWGPLHGSEVYLGVTFTLQDK
ncbi:TonB-dependent receptor domain-containing protein [Roseivirga sp. BDSF3-8]|uniref:TonB-dependent receptor n=1 Tax=Roseivirga sp. BDSF3-8 TaxID=3241598 RepID=UPI003531A606